MAALWYSAGVIVKLLQLTAIASTGKCRVLLCGKWIDIVSQKRFRIA
jgi:hypothetical protein